MNFSQSGYFPGYNHNIDEALIKKIKTVYKKLQLPIVDYQFSAVSDGNVLNNNGIKTIVLTDGVVGPHTTNEKISVNDLNKLTEIIYTLFSDL